MATHETYMHRCLQLAQLGEGSVAPNPMVGAVLVYEDRIIGEGYHHQYGQAHAEVNCIQSVSSADLPLIPDATLYVSLEPCAHFGKTPPCADLIIEKGIRHVVVGCRDPFPEVDGKGIDKLHTAGIIVTLGVLEKECLSLNKRFFTFHTHYRPYILLKWAQTADAKIANEDHSRVFISNAYSNRLVHQLRSQQMGILVGTNTALFDDPSLTTRLWPGKDPIRLVVDMDLRLPSTLQLFTTVIPTIVFNKHKHTLESVKNVDWSTSVQYYQVTGDVSLVHQITHALFQLNIQSVLVEGGAQLLQSFIDEGLWDEAFVITNDILLLGQGLPAPLLKHQTLLSSEILYTDRITCYKNLHH